MKRILIILSIISLIGCKKDPTIYSLTVSSNPPEGGTITPTSGEYEEGTEVTLTVTPNSNYEFDKWSGSWSGSESPLTITMDGDKNLVGNFKLMDSDGDGVTDDIDTCPNTQVGTSVDESGCESNPIYIDENGVTIKSYEWGKVGDTGVINGVTYTIVDNLSNFDGDFSKVCTSKVTEMRYLFFYNIQDGEIDISHWDVSNVTDMYSMFYESEFNGDISHWDVSNVTDMSRMFGGWVNTVSQFNGDISNWNVSSVTNMEGMFMYSPFNGDISNWNVSNVINMDRMFYKTTFNQDISSWDVSNVTNMSEMFIYSKFNRNISDWDVSNVTNMYRMFESSEFNQNLSSWNVSNVIQCNSFWGHNPQWTLPKPNFTNCNLN